MKTKSLCSFLVMALVATGIMTGCETTGQSTGLGAVLGGAAGYAIGGKEGALIGAAIGGVAGFAYHKAKERRVKTAEQTAQEYKYQPSEGLRVDLRPATTASPSTVPQGTTMNAELEYAVMGAGDSGTTIVEQQIIKKDGEELVRLRDEGVQRADGTWNVLTPIEVNSDVEPGNYELVQTITVANSDYSTKTPITVTTATAGAKPKVIYGQPEFVVASR